MYEKPKRNRVAVVGTFRKSNGAVGSDRKNNSGKKAVVYQLDAKGNRKEIGRAEGPTMKALSQKLRSAGLVPHHVALNKYGETAY